LAKAEEIYTEVLSAQPNNFDARHLNGVFKNQRGEHAQTLSLIAKALKTNAHSAAAHSNYGSVLAMLNWPEEAIASYAQAITLQPNFIDTMIAQGNTFYAMGRFAEALASYERALAIKPGFAETHNNSGNALWCLKLPLEALAHYDAALTLKPDYAEAHNNRGNALRDFNRNTDATASFERANALNPQLAEAHWNKALLSLSRGDYAAGWRGEDLSSETTLLHAEQGFGDTIQFASDIPMVLAKGGKVILEVPDAMMLLLSDIDGVTAMVSRGAPLPQFYLHCPLMSLPLAFGTTLATIPAAMPYLCAPASRIETWRARLPQTGKRRVGIALSGMASNNNDHNRSIALARLA